MGARENSLHQGVTVDHSPDLDALTADVDLLDFDARDELDASFAEAARVVVSGLPARPGTVRR
jgi:hypothetical protein